MRTLKELKNKHEGETCFVIGTGPSLDGIDLTTITGPRILINRSAFVVPYSDGESYWMVIDNWWEYGFSDTWFKTLDKVKDGCGLIGVFRDEEAVSGKVMPDGSPNVPDYLLHDNIIIWRASGKTDAKCLSYTRDEIAQKNKLYPNHGSANSAAHLAWYMGCIGINIVGIDGSVVTGVDSYSSLLSNEYNDPKTWTGDYSRRKENLFKMAAVLKLKVKDYSNEITA